jgi:uncharacterized protein YjbI with pentapeptide repeats
MTQKELVEVLSSSNGVGSLLEGQRLIGLKFYGMPGGCLTGVSLAGSVLVSASFTRCDISGANFDGALLDQTDFIGCVFTGLTFRGAIFAGPCLWV